MSKTIKTPEWSLWYRFTVFIVNFEHNWRLLYRVFIVDFDQLNVSCTSWKVSEYGVFSGQYSVQMQENTKQKKLRIWTIFSQWKTFLNMFFTVHLLTQESVLVKTSLESQKFHYLSSLIYAKFIIWFWQLRQWRQNLPFSKTGIQKHCSKEYFLWKKMFFVTA